MTCGINGCENEIKWRGLCSTHYYRWYRGHDIPTFQGVSKNRQPDIETSQPNDLDLGWLAGLLEGEGYFSFDNTQRIVLKMVDEDIVVRYKKLLEQILRLQEPIRLFVDYSGKRNDQVIYRITINGANARAIMKLIVPLMGNRRRIALWQSINRYKPKKINLVSLILEKSA